MNYGTQYPAGPQPYPAQGQWAPPQAGQYAYPPQAQPVFPYGVQQPMPQPVGYAPPQPAYYGQPVQPVPVYGTVYAPPFAIGGTRAPRDPRLSGASKTLNRMCLLVLGQTAFAFFWELIFLTIMTLTGADIYTNDMAYLWLSAAMVPLSTALPFALYLIFTKADPSLYLRFEKVGLFGGALCVLGGLAICLLGNYPAYVIQDLLGRFGYEPTTNVFAQPDSWNAFLLEFLSTAVLVPVMEEFAFRGVLLSALRKYGLGFSIVASALVFSLVHLDFANVVFAFIAGLVLGFLFARTNNLWITIFIHALTNGIAVITNHAAFLFGDNMATVAENAFMLVPIALGVLALVILFFFKRDLFITYLSPRYDGPQKPLRGGETAVSIVRAPLFWVVVGMMALYTGSLFW